MNFISDNPRKTTVQIYLRRSGCFYLSAGKYYARFKFFNNGIIKRSFPVKGFHSFMILEKAGNVKLSEGNFEDFVT